MRRAIPIPLSAALLFCFLPLARAQQPLDPQLKTLLDEIVAAYSKINRYHEKFVYTVGNGPGQTIESVEFRLERPNRFSLRRQIRESSGSASPNVSVSLRWQLIISDGAQIGRWSAERKTFIRDKLPARLADIPDFPMVSPTLFLLLRNEDPFTPLAQQGGFSLGKPEKLGELEVDVIEFTATSPETHAVGKGRILVGKRDRLLRKITFEVTEKEPMTGRDVVKSSEIVWQIVNPAPTFAPTEFKFIAPGANAPTPPAGNRSTKNSGGARPDQKSGKPK
jgi:hypothetical protein